MISTFPLGSADRPTSRLALGCMSLVPNLTYTGVEERQAIATVQAALDAGINFFDNAIMYGDGAAETVLGKALEGRREGVVISTKISVGGHTAEAVAADCEASLRRLRTDHIDLLQIHWPHPTVPMEETAAAMVRLVEAGKVGVLGVCNFGPRQLEQFLGAAPCVTDQVVYNLLSRGVEFGLQAHCLSRGVGLLCYSPLAQGLLTGRYATADEVPVGRARTRHFRGDRPQVRHGGPGYEELTFATLATLAGIAREAGLEMADLAMAWLLGRPAVKAILVGASSPEQVARNVRAASLVLPPDLVEALDGASDALKKNLGPALDLWGNPPRSF